MRNETVRVSVSKEELDQWEAFANKHGATVPGLMRQTFREIMVQSEQSEWL